MSLRDRWPRPAPVPSPVHNEWDAAEALVVAAGVVMWATTGEPEAPIRFNRAGADFFGLGPVATREQVRTMFHGEDRARCWAELRAAVETGGTHLIEGRVVLSDGAERLVLIRLTAELGPNPRATTVQALQLDVTDQRLAEHELLHKATHDALTGLANRTLFVDRLDHAIARARRSRTAVAVLIVNLRGFSDINSALGRAAADELLVKIADRMRLAVRDIDAVARLGGDEFGIAASVEDVVNARRLAERVREMLAAPLEVGPGADRGLLSIRAAIGIALAPQHGEDSSKLLRFADLAMCQAKRTGDANCVFTPELEHTTRSRLRILGDLHQAIDTSPLAPFGLRLRYEPVIGLADRKVAWQMAETMWQHPVHGVVEGEELRMLLELGELHPTVAAWSAGQAARSSVPVQIALSTRSVHGEPFHAWIEDLLRRLPVSPARLGVTLSPRELLLDRAGVVRGFSLLRDRQIAVTLQAVEGSLATVGHLGDLFADAIVLDRALIARALAPRDGVVARAFVDLAHELGARVVATDVRDSRTLDALIRLGCDLACGPAVHALLVP